MLAFWPHLGEYAREIWALLGDAARGWIDHQASRIGAALAFYTVFSLGPILLLAVAIAGFFFGPGAARGHVYADISALIGPGAAAQVKAVLMHSARPTAGVVATAVSIVTFTISATTALVELKSGLDEIWGVPTHERQWFWSYLLDRLLAIVFIVALGLILLVSLLASAALSALGSLSQTIGIGALIVDWTGSVVSFALAALLFAIVYKVLPSVRIAWRDVWVGATITAALVAAGRLAIDGYIGVSRVAPAYGAAGSLIVVLLWVYYSAQVFLFGAEITQGYARRFGSYRLPR